MTRWREQVLAEFTANHAAAAPLTLLADADELFADQHLLDAVRETGFDVLRFEDPVLFRHYFETIWRPAWALTDQRPLLVVVPGGALEVEALPYDVLERARRRGRILSQFELSQLFPSLSPSVLRCLEKSDLDLVGEVATRPGSPRLDDDQTWEHILRTVFKVDPEAVNGEVELLRVLLDRHRHRRTWPPALVDWFVGKLRRNRAFKGWPLARIAGNPGDFLAFLQERWPAFVHDQAARRGEVAEGPPDVSLLVPGPASLPLDAPELRGYLEECFAEGALLPATVAGTSGAPGGWFLCGVSGSPRPHAERFGRALAEVEQKLPSESAGWNDWLDLAMRWGHLTRLRFVLPEEAAAPFASQLLKLDDTLDRRFDRFLRSSFGSLPQCQSSLGPVMVHQIAAHLKQRLFSRGAAGKSRIALLVVDGLALPQWLHLSSHLQATRRWAITERACFAWIPTLTTVSRQAIFAGEIPAGFADTIDSTYKEEARWSRVWADADLAASEIAFLRQGESETETQLLSRLKSVMSAPKVRSLAVTLNAVDQLVHGMPAGPGMRGVYDALDQVARGLRPIIETLLGDSFDVVLTADHGNVETIGVGGPKMGALPEAKGSRAWLFSDQGTRQAALLDAPEALAWPAVGLPEGYLPLLAPPRRSFASPGGTSVTHGGASLGEVMVPFVTITNRA